MVDFNKFKLLEGEKDLDVNELQDVNPEKRETLFKFFKRKQTHYRGRFTEFVQVECGYKHTLLLNKKG